MSVGLEGRTVLSARDCGAAVLCAQIVSIIRVVQNSCIGVGGRRHWQQYMPITSFVDPCTWNYVARQSVDRDS
jgi:hypothetical protein